MSDGVHGLQQLSAHRRSLSAWFERPLGRALLAGEAERLGAILPKLYGTVAVQLGRAGKVDLLESCQAPTRLVLDVPYGAPSAARSSVLSTLDALPLDQRSVDVALLPHALEFAPDPHQVLREVQRVLAPEGHVVILGFNPFSLWGVRKLVTRRGRRAPWCGQFIGLLRLKDWLKLLGFELVQGGMLFYRPPVVSQRILDRLQFLDRMGDRWWPMGGAVYVVVAKKRVVGMTPLRPAWRSSGMLNGTVARPVAFVANHRSATIIPWPRRVPRRRSAPR